MEQNLALFSSLSAEIDEDVSYEVDSEAYLPSPHHSTSPKKKLAKKERLFEPRLYIHNESPFYHFIPPSLSLFSLFSLFLLIHYSHFL